MSLSHALLQAACPVALLVGDLTLAERYIKAIMGLSARHAVDLWNVGGRCFAGMLLIKHGNIGDGLELLRTAFARVPENAFNLLYILFLDEIADPLGRDGKAAEGLSTIDEALARSERTEERWCVAELLRIKGELILRKGAPRPRRRLRSTFCVRSIGHSGRAPCHGSCEHPQALPACSMDTVGSPRHAAFCNRHTIALARVLRPPT